MAVGMAIAEAHLAETFNKPNFNVVDHYTYVMCGDGCLMEGISEEALSLAGTLGLEKLIVLYDSNNISIEGSTDIAFTEDVRQRMASYGFQTILVKDGNNLDEIQKAIDLAKAEKIRPSFIEIKTVIGYGCEAKQGTPAAHGEPLGEETILGMKEFFEWPSTEPFFVPDEVYAHYNEIIEGLAKPEDDWNRLFAEYCEKFPEMKEKWDFWFDRSKVAEALDMSIGTATKYITSTTTIFTRLLPTVFSHAATATMSTRCKRLIFDFFLYAT